MTLRERAKYFHSLGTYLPQWANVFLVWHIGLRGVQYELRHGLFGKAKFKHYVEHAAPSAAEMACKLHTYSGVHRFRFSLLRTCSRAMEIKSSVESSHVGA